MHRPPPDSQAAVARLAVGQHGLVTGRQLRDLGLTNKAIRGRVANGHLAPAATGVFRVAGSPVTWESRVLSHVLAASDGAVASHRTAAALWNLEDCRPGKPEISVRRGKRYDHADVRAHRSTDLDRIEVVRRAGIPATPIERTLLDLGAVVPLERVHVALDDARRRNLTDWDRLLGCLTSHARKGRDGVATLRAILDQHFGEIAKTDSGFERLVFSRLVEAGLPRPMVQYEVTLGPRAYRLDLAYPGHRVAIELDGAVHLRREIWEKDHGRQNALILAGWTILRFTWRDYIERPYRLVSEVRAALAAAA